MTNMDEIETKFKESIGGLNYEEDYVTLRNQGPEWKDLCNAVIAVVALTPNLHGPCQNLGIKITTRYELMVKKGTDTRWTKPRGMSFAKFMLNLVRNGANEGCTEFGKLVIKDLSMSKRIQNALRLCVDIVQPLTYLSMVRKACAEYLDGGDPFSKFLDDDGNPIDEAQAGAARTTKPIDEIDDGLSLLRGRGMGNDDDPPNAFRPIVIPPPEERIMPDKEVKSKARIKRIRQAQELGTESENSGDEDFDPEIAFTDLSREEAKDLHEATVARNRARFKTLDENDTSSEKVANKRKKLEESSSDSDGNSDSGSDDDRDKSDDEDESAKPGTPAPKSLEIRQLQEMIESLCSKTQEEHVAYFKQHVLPRDKSGLQRNPVVPGKPPLKHLERPVAVEFVQNILKIRDEDFPAAREFFQNGTNFNGNRFRPDQNDTMIQILNLLLKGPGNACILSSGMGAGKTAMLIGATRYRMLFYDDKRKVLIMCPNTIVTQWADQLDHWLPKPNVYAVTCVSQLLQAVEKANYTALKEHVYLVVGYQALGMRAHRETLHDFLTPGRCIIAFDEGHMNLRDPEGLYGSAAASLIQREEKHLKVTNKPSNNVIYMSGTPIIGTKPDEGLKILNCLFDMPNKPADATSDEAVAQNILRAMSASKPVPADLVPRDAVQYVVNVPRCDPKVPLDETKLARSHTHGNGIHPTEYPPAFYAFAAALTLAKSGQGGTLLLYDSVEGVKQMKVMAEQMDEGERMFFLHGEMSKQEQTTEEQRFAGTDPKKGCVVVGTMALCTTGRNIFADNGLIWLFTVGDNYYVHADNKQAIARLARPPCRGQVVSIIFAHDDPISDKTDGHAHKKSRNVAHITGEKMISTGKTADKHFKKIASPEETMAILVSVKKLAENDLAINLKNGVFKLSSVSPMQTVNNNKELPKLLEDCCKCLERTNISPGRPASPPPPPPAKEPTPPPPPPPPPPPAKEHTELPEKEATPPPAKEPTPPSSDDIVKKVVDMVLDFTIALEYISLIKNMVSTMLDLMIEEHGIEVVKNMFRAGQALTSYETFLNQIPVEERLMIERYFTLNDFEDTASLAAEMPPELSDIKPQEVAPNPADIAAVATAIKDIIDAVEAAATNAAAVTATETSASDTATDAAVQSGIADGASQADLEVSDDDDGLDPLAGAQDLQAALSQAAGFFA